MLRKTYILVTFAVLALLTPLAIGASAGESDGDATDVELAKVSNVEEQARATLAVLEQSRSAADALPAEYAERMAKRASFGMNPELSRRAIANTTSSVYVIPARGHVCASLTDPNGVTTTCQPTADIAEGRVGAATVNFEVGVAVYGLVPDGVDAVSIQTRSGSRAVATEDNAYYTVVGAGDRVKSVSYVGPSGPVEFALADPGRATREP